MKFSDKIKESISKKDSDQEITRKIYSHYPTRVFLSDLDKEFYIKNEIAVKFEIPFTNVMIVGSSKTGFSFFKDTEFTPGESDLDIAVVNNNLFMKFMVEAHANTNGFADETNFPIFKGQNVKSQFVRNLKHGYINPFFMPRCDIRTEWLEFYLELSNKHFDLFKSINGGIYSSEYFYEYKQEECIKLFKENPNRYDKISS